VGATLDAIASYQQAVASLGTTNVLQIAGLLTELSGELASHNQLGDATAAQRAVVDVLRAHTVLSVARAVRTR